MCWEELRPDGLRLRLNWEKWEPENPGWQKPGRAEDEVDLGPSFLPGISGGSEGAAEAATWDDQSVFSQHITGESVSLSCPLNLDANRWRSKRRRHTICSWTNADDNRSVLTCCCDLAAFPGWPAPLWPLTAWFLCSAAGRPAGVSTEHRPRLRLLLSYFSDVLGVFPLLSLTFGCFWAFYF